MYMWFFTESLKVEEHLEGLGVDGSIILKLLLTFWRLMSTIVVVPHR